MHLTDHETELIRGVRALDEKRRLAISGIPVRFHDLERRGDWTELRQATAEIQEHYVAKFAQEPRMHAGKGVLLSGRPGVGKTTLAALCGLDLIRSGLWVIFMRAEEWIWLQQRQMTLQRAWERYEDQSAHDEWFDNDEKLTHMRDLAHLVILDDLGKEHRGNGWATGSVEAFLRHRYDRGRPTFLTTNLTADGLSARYGEPMASFVNEACFVYEDGAR